MKKRKYVVSNDGMVIVGSGHAGARAAQALRLNGWQGGIVVVEAEETTPCERPPLSKAVLSGASRPEDHPLFPHDFLARQAVDLRRGTRAVEVECGSRRVRLSDGSSLFYERLLLAPGAAPRMLDVPGAALNGTGFLRSAADATRMASWLQPGTGVVIVGGGLIGLEAAATAIGRRCEVTVIEAGGRLMTRAVPSQMSDLVQRHHEDRGVRFRLGRQVTALQGVGRVSGVELDDGSTIPCSVVLVAIGVAPRVELAQAAGLEIDNGIAADGFLCCSEPSVFTAGDACAFETSTGQRVRLESWKNAEDQGALAARNMLGAHEPYLPVPWMWSDQYESTMQITGFPERGDQHAIRTCVDGTLLVYHLGADDAITGVSGFGSVREVARGVRTGQMLMQKNFHPGRAALEDPSADLKALAKMAAA
jgi:NADPH-dependent 2,4-dienoyl-CoA reductase/sulfur reductase-like enzyme